MKLFLEISFAVLLCIQSTRAFAPVAPSAARSVSSPFSGSPSALSMANDDDLLRYSRASRQAGNDDNVVELMRPLGLVLNQDEDGNVYVETVAPRGNAARTGRVRTQSHFTDNLVAYCIDPPTHNQLFLGEHVQIVFK